VVEPLTKLGIDVWHVANGLRSFEMGKRFARFPEGNLVSLPLPPSAQPRAPR
jgi:hypothetical protein